MASNTERESGFYWVKYLGKWMVASYTKSFKGEEVKDWYLAEYDGVFEDKDFANIDETPISRNASDKTEK